MIGNTAIAVSLAIMSKRQSHASNNTSLFLASLSLADLLFLLVYVPLDLWRQVDTSVYQTAPVCKMISYVEMLTALASVINLSAVSMERYIVIVHPMKSRALCTLTNCRKALLVVWLLSVVLALPVVYTNENWSVKYIENTTSADGSVPPRAGRELEYFECTEDSNLDNPPVLGVFVAAYQMVIIFLLPVILMSSSYYRVITALWRSTKNMTALTNTRAEPSGYLMDTANHSMMEADQNIYPDTGSFNRTFKMRTSFRNDLRNDNSSQSVTFTRGPLEYDEQSNSRVNRAVSQRGDQRYVLQQQSRSTVNKTKKINQSRKQIIKMLLVIILVFTICWCPRFLLNLIKWVAPMGGWENMEFNVSQPFYYFSRIAKLLPVIHAMLNPIIYSLMSGSVRRSVLTCCNRLFSPTKPEPCSEVVNSSRRWRGDEVSNRFEHGMERDQVNQGKRKATLSTTICQKGEDDMEGEDDCGEQVAGQTIKQEILQQLELSSLEFAKAPKKNCSLLSGLMSKLSGTSSVPIMQERQTVSSIL